MNGDESAEKDLEHWDRVIQSHPDFIARKKAEAEEWENAQREVSGWVSE